MNEPFVPRERDVASPIAIGAYRLADRIEGREVGTLNLARRDVDTELLWWVDVAKLPEIGATWADVVRAFKSIANEHVLVPRATGESGSIRWMAFEPFVYETLAGMLRRIHAERSAVPWQIACRIVSEAATAVHSLHSCKDGARRPWPLVGTLSATSIAVRFDGRTVLFDPGRLFPLQLASSDALAYAAPERVWSEPSDARADVFALGVMLWELCAGRRLFRGRDDDETRALLEAHVVPELASRVRGAPPSLDALLRRALARQPEDRFEDAAELAMECAALADTAGITSEQVASYMHEHFEEREYELNEKIITVSEATEVRDSTGPTPILSANTDETTLPQVVRSGFTSTHTLTREEVTLPRVALPLPPAPPRPRLESKTEMVDEESITRRHEPSDEEPPEQKTSPRISGSQIPAAEPVSGDIISSDGVVLLPDSNTGSTLEPATRRVGTDRPKPPVHVDDDHTAQTPLQETRVRPPRHESFAVTREEGTPTNILVDGSPRRGSEPATNEVRRPSGGFALQRPATPLEPPARPHRPSAGAIRVARPAAEPVAVARPGPVPAPPRPPARTIPPVASPAPPPVAMTGTIQTVGPSANGPTSAPVSLGGPPTVHAPLQAPLPATTAMPAVMPLGSQPLVVPSPHGVVPQLGAIPLMPPMHAMPMQGAMPMLGMGQPMPMPMPMQPLAAPHAMPQVTSDSVAFGPVAPAASTVIDEPAEKVIVDGPVPPAPLPPVGFPPPRAPEPVAQASAPPAVQASEPARDALILPRDPQMSAMRRALVARESVREPERRIAVPLVIGSLVLAVGVAIGIPLLTRKPTRVVSAATSASVPSASAITPATAVTPAVASVPAATGVVTGAATGAVPGALPGAPNPAFPGSATAPLGAQPPPPPLVPTAPSPVNPLALPDSNRSRSSSASAGTSSRTRRSGSQSSSATKPPRSERTERSSDRDDDDDEAPLPKEFEQRERPSTSKEPKESTSSSSPGGKGLLTVVCSPPCDEVLDGSRSLGPSPVVKVSVSAGSHRLTLRISEPPLEKVVTVTVSPDETTFLTQPMTK